MIKQADWIMYKDANKEICPSYKRIFELKKECHSVKLYVTARGVYDAHINGTRISNYVLAPGWTVYEKRHQYQEYDITDMVQSENELIITVANGWFQFEEANWLTKEFSERKAGAIIALIKINYNDGSKDIIVSDEKWEVGSSNLIYSDIYNGEIYDATKVIDYFPVKIMNYDKDCLISQEGEIICEHERVRPLKYIVTPKGEKVIDFGQNITGYVEFKIDAKKGDRIKISHAEILDSDGNFYTENYRAAKANIIYVCKEGFQTHKPSHNFYGFRYIRLDEYPEDVELENFVAIAVYSDIERTGYLSSGHSMLNQFFSNVFWGQKDNYLDIPTDCPQRDERLGWTGDAQVFIKTACYNYNVKKFFGKWLKDLAAEQFENGMVPQTVPDVLKINSTSTAWGDAAVICPWQLYLMYGDKNILKNQFNSMKKWVDYIGEISEEKHLWIGGEHHGDHLALDGAVDRKVGVSCIGLSDHNFISSAFYAYSTELLIKAGKVLCEDVSYYEILYNKIVDKFRKRYPVYKTITEHTLAIVFGLTQNTMQTAQSLVKVLAEYEDALVTGFVGTPYLLYALSQGGYYRKAYDLLLREEFPSWLFSVKMGATTIWEHWDGLREDGSVWDSAMNSFNHYSYGSVLSWVYEIAAGIKPITENPGFEKVKIEPHPDARLGHLEARLETQYGTIRSYWVYQQEGSIKYEISVPTEAEIKIDGKTIVCPKGNYQFYSKLID